MTAFKLICSDIDGTLLNKDRALEGITIEQIKSVENNMGIPFVLISARMPQAMRHLQQKLDNKEALVCFNGALILDGNNNELVNQVMPLEAVKSILEQTQTHNIHMSVFHKDEWFVNKMDYWAKREENNTQITPVLADIESEISRLYSVQNGLHKILLMGDAYKMDQIEQHLREYQQANVAVYRSKDTYIEINVNTVSKKTAIEVLENHYQISKDQIMAFGDNDNDVEMLDYVGHGVAVGNAKPKVMAIANDTTLTNKEHGVALYLKKWTQQKNA